MLLWSEDISITEALPGCQSGVMASDTSGMVVGGGEGLLAAEAQAGLEASC